ncbi:MAG: histidinol-phosphatase HisJ family protein [Candidatus Cloacimonas sp.]|jgi:histidinol-phosphatase (PHP family)|nr:histidinol-phosphatase HisJ family protein [Candidatus Cloacimonas sp.]
MKYDYHIHSEDSFDSRIIAEELILKAISLQYNEIAFTEHVDLLPEELALFGISSLSRYRARITALQERFPQLKILCGIEIGDFHRVQNYALELIKDLNFEIILGAVHILTDHTNVAIPLSQPLSEAQVRDYYEHNLALVTNCPIDVLAHLGVYKRYYPSIPDESAYLSTIEQIFATMIQRGIALEINYSAYRKNYPSHLPEPHLVDLYISLGGNLFSIGSDSHHIDHFDDNRHKVPNYPSFRHFTSR